MGDQSLQSSGGIAFRYPGFRHYMLARTLVATSSEMVAVAVAWQVYSLTHRPLDLGFVGLAQFLPGILLFLISGQAADHFPRQRILQTCFGAFSLCALLLLAFTLHGLRSVYPIYFVLLLLGTVRAFNGPASQSFLPLLVPPEHFPNAVAWSSSFFQGSMVVGPMIGGLIYGWTGSPIPVYALASVAYLAALGLISLIRVPSAARSKVAAPALVVLDGLRYIGRNKLILGTISLDLFAVLLGGAVGPSARLRAGNSGSGGLWPGPAAQRSRSWRRGHGHHRRSLALATACRRNHAGLRYRLRRFHYRLRIIAEPWAILAALMLAGACDMVSVIIRHTVVQLGTPDQMRGRVSAVNMVFIGASNEVGAV